MVLNRYPWWKNLLVVFVIVIAFFYALPNLYIEDPSVQISTASPTITMDQATINQVKQALDANHLTYKQIDQQNRGILVRFASTDIQLKAKDLIQQTLGENYLVALNLAPATPNWLRTIGA